MQYRLYVKGLQRLWKVYKDCVFTYCVDQYEEFFLIIFKRKMKAN